MNSHPTFRIVFIGIIAKTRVRGEGLERSPTVAEVEESGPSHFGGGGQGLMNETYLVVCHNTLQLRPSVLIPIRMGQPIYCSTVLGSSVFFLYVTLIT